MWKRKLTPVQCSHCYRHLMARRSKGSRKWQIFDRGRWRKGWHQAKDYVCLRCRHNKPVNIHTTFGIA